MKTNLINSAIGAFLLVIAAGCSDINFSYPDSGMDYTSSEGSGKGGSTARFTIAGDHLYTLSNQYLSGLRIGATGTLTQTSQLYVDGNMETIFPLGNTLFLGSTTGMYLFDITNREQPKYLSMYQHIVSCDPVVAQGHYAYVTLRSDGLRCNRSVNELHVIDIADPANLKSTASNVVKMNSPKGLAIDGDLLFVCDGDSLKVFDASNTPTLKKVSSFYTPDAWDVISTGSNLIITGNRGITQYQSNGLTISELSKIYTN